MVISEIKGYVRGINYDSSKGVWVQAEMCHSGLMELFSAELPIDFEHLQGVDLIKFLHNRKIKVTIETIDNDDEK